MDVNNRQFEDTRIYTAEKLQKFLEKKRIIEAILCIANELDRLNNNIEKKT